MKREEGRGKREEGRSGGHRPSRSRDPYKTEKAVPIRRAFYR